MKILRTLLALASCLPPLLPYAQTLVMLIFRQECLIMVQKLSRCLVQKDKNECRIRFQGSGMWVEGQGGIQSNQYLSYRYDRDGDETYNYIRYRSKRKEKTALFLFSNASAQQDFIRALFRWKRQASQPIPNYRLPASQGVQDTQGRDKSYGVPMNPYERPPITDWDEKTTP